MMDMDEGRYRPDRSDVRPGDRLIFSLPGVADFGGAVWQSPTTGDVIAGDTFLSLRGEWLPAGDNPELSVTLDTSHRRPGEEWSPKPTRRLR